MPASITQQRYTGPTLEGQRHGHGKYFFTNKCYVYEGPYVHGKKQGTGKLTLSNGFYEGDFADNEIEGVGVRHWEDGTTYDGSFMAGEKHGFGVLNAASGAVYEGHWKANKRHGSGKLSLANGDTYEGGFQDHLYNGKGTLTTRAFRYEGDWLAGRRHGLGMQQDAGGQTYQGEWQEDLPHGQGSSSCPTTGISYTGTFMRGTAPQPQRLVASLAEGPAAGQPVWVQLGEVTAGPITVASQAPSSTSSTADWVALAGESGRLITATLHQGEPAPDDDPLKFGNQVALVSGRNATEAVPHLVQRTSNGEAVFANFTIGQKVEEKGKGQWAPEPGLYTLRFSATCKDGSCQDAFVLLSLTEPGKKPPAYKPPKPTVKK